MSSSTSTKKRKAVDDITDEGQVDRPAPALRAGAKKPAAQVDADDGLTPPAPVWGHVLLLDYMPCQEVRSALLTCKIMANGAVTCVHTLNVMQVCQMDGPAARRFPNVEEVNYFSLLSVNLRQTVERRLLELYELIANRPLPKSVFGRASERHLCQVALGTHLRDCYIAKHEI